MFVKTYYVFTPLFFSLVILISVYILLNSPHLLIYLSKTDLYCTHIFDFLGLIISTPKINSFIFFLIITTVLNYYINCTIFLLILVSINNWFLTYPETISLNLNYLNKNLLLDNTLNLVHPPLLYLSWSLAFAVLTCLFLFNLLNYWGGPWILKSNFNLLIPSTYSTLITLILGSFWAWQTGTWGGWWVWDSSEVLLLLLFILNCLILHKVYNIKLKNDAKSITLLLLVIFIYWKITFNLLDNSLHTFFTNNFSILEFFPIQLILQLYLTLYFFNYVLYNYRTNKLNECGFSYSLATAQILALFYCFKHSIRY